jgi:hypothetical protein
MSDDLVKRYSSYNIMMLGDSGNEVSTPDGEWVKYKDYKAQADHIEELEAKLAKAVKLIEYAIELGRWDLNPSLRDDLIDFSAELKGETDE